jgi:DNA-directed RNA polymerase specialized sigma24 family protein
MGAGKHAPANGFDIGRSMTNDFLAANGSQEEPAVFDARFSRCFRLLHFVACRVLGGPERAHDAIEACWLTTSRNSPRFEYEGEFRRWLVRVLIDEALAILRNETKSVIKHLPQPVPIIENWKVADYCFE